MTPSVENLMAALKEIRAIANRENGDANNDCLEILDIAESVLGDE